MVDDSDDGADTVRGGVPPVTTLRGVGDAAAAELGNAATGIAAPLPPRPAALPDEPSAVALPPPPSVASLHMTRRDSPLARSRGDSRPPPADETARYRFGEVLGEGGMGEVLLAHDEHIGREVAVKRIRSTEPTAEELSRFVREARVQGRLEHPAVVPVHDLAVDRDGRPFFVMKRVTLPAEVAHRIERIDTESAQHLGRLAAASLLGHLGFVPLLVWTGVRDPVFVVAFALVAAVSCLHVYMLSRRTAFRGGIYLNACINAVLIALIARMVGPFIIAPTLAITTLMAYAAHPKFGRITVMAAILGASVALPWALELLGIVAPSYRFTAGGDLVLTSSVVRFSAVAVEVSFAVLLVGLLAVVGLLSRGMARRQREATRQLELHAWHLRQVVPSLAR